MVLAAEVTVDGRQQAAMVLFPNALYLSTDKTVARLESQLVWCSSCGGFQAGEMIDSYEVMETRLTEPLEEDLYRFLFNCDPEKLAEHHSSLRRSLHWRTMRRSPPKCLECGGSEIRPLDGKNCLDGLGRTISASMVFASTSICHRLFLYDTEGALLGEVSRICPETNDYINDAYPYAKLVAMLPADTTSQ